MAYKWVEGKFANDIEEMIDNFTDPEWSFWNFNIKDILGVQINP